jgi:GLPGLI family protein
MKTLALIAFTFALALPLAAQEQSDSALEGAIRYEVTRTLDVQLPPEMAAMQDQIPSEVKSERLVRFTERAALTTTPAPTEDPADVRSGGALLTFESSGSDDDATYLDLEAGTFVRKQSFLGRTFRITGETERLPWRLTSETGAFLGYATQKAVATVDSVTYEAWFTTALPAPIGPEQYGGLPGAILVLTKGDGMLAYVAQEIELKRHAEAIEPPEGGREVTQEEYERIVAERLEEMGASPSGSGTMTIRIN